MILCTESNGKKWGRQSLIVKWVWTQLVIYKSDMPACIAYTFTCTLYFLVFSFLIKMRIHSHPRLQDTTECSPICTGCFKHYVFFFFFLIVSERPCDFWSLLLWRIESPKPQWKLFTKNLNKYLDNIAIIYSSNRFFKCVQDIYTITKEIFKGI